MLPFLGETWPIATRPCASTRNVKLASWSVLRYDSADLSIIVVRSMHCYHLSTGQQPLWRMGKPKGSLTTRTLLAIYFLTYVTLSQ